MAQRANSLSKVCVFIGSVAAIALLCCTGGKEAPKEETDTAITSSTNEVRPLNLSVFVDLSDRITKETDNMKQADKDQQIINGLAELFVQKQTNEGFSKSNDCFQIVFYPAPAGADSLANNMSLDLKSIKGPKKRPLLNFAEHHAECVKMLYESALNETDYFGSDIWGYFAKDKVKDLYKKGYRNVLVILSDSYVFDKHNKIKEGNNYSYILPQTLAINGSGLIPCNISNSDMEVYFIECNAIPQTDYPKMKAILERWFHDMGIEDVDIQDTDIPSNTLKHLNKSIFN